MRIKSPAAWAGLGTWLFYVAFLPPLTYSIDSNSMLAVAESLALRGSFAIDPVLGQPGRGGEFFSIWYPLLSILEAPFVLLAHFACRVLGKPQFAHYASVACAMGVPITLSAASVALTAWIARALGGRQRSALLAAAGCAFGSCMLVYGRTLYADALLAFLVTAAFASTLRAGGRRIEPVCAGLALLAKPTGILLGPLLAARAFLAKQPLRRVVAPLLGAATGLAFYLLYNWYRFGSPLSAGERPAFDPTYFPVGLVRVLVSPGYGFFAYNPALLLFPLAAWRLRGRRTVEGDAILLAVLAFVGLHACWSTYGVDWGPRHLLAITPLAFAAVGAVGDRVRDPVLAALIALGFAINAPTLVSNFEWRFMEAAEQGVTTDRLVWFPRESPLLNGWRSAARQVGNASGADVRALVKEATEPHERKLTMKESFTFRTVPAWWWFTPLLGIPRAFGVAAAALLAIAGALCWVRAFRTPERG